MNNIIETTSHKEKIAANFSKAANTYDEWALPQEVVAKKTVKLIPFYLRPKQTIDLGCGTGNIIKELIKFHPESNITGIDLADGMVEYCRKIFIKKTNIDFLNIDIELFESLKLYDLAISSFSLQWLSNPISTFNTVYNLLNSGGYFIFSIPIDGSLYELSDSFEKTLGKKIQGLNFYNENFYINILNKCSFKIINFDISETSGSFNNFDIFKYFKLTGTTLNKMHDKSPLRISDLNKLMNFYKKKYSLDNNTIPVTYKVLYIIAKK
jgi:malonyl-CoA O-methyltransferase